MSGDQKTFAFPFPPYDIQVEFMRNLYDVIDKGGIGIFESPTGTGKSLSLICGALTWLKDFEEKQNELPEEKLNNREGSKQDSDLPDWVLEYGEKKKKQEQEFQMKEQNEKLKKQRAHLEQIKSTSRMSFALKGKRRLSDDQKEMDEQKKENEVESEIDEILGKSKDPDADIILAEYHSDDDNDDSTDDDNEDEIHCMKIYYCSRTHSQLAQFTREIQKSPFSETRVVTLGSRQNFCINEDVKKLKSNTRINDKCLELQKHKTKGATDVKKDDSGKTTKKKKIASGCPFNSHKQRQEFRDQILIGIREIEDLVSLGEDLHACPYYGTRQAIPAAQLVCLPYNLLLSKPARQACGIKLQGNIVIIDEAHNLLETINSVHSVEITGVQITDSCSQLSQYLGKYRSRLKAKNLMYIKQILFILSRLQSCLGGKSPDDSKVQSQSSHAASNKTEVKLQKINNFLFATQIDNVNLFKVCRYCERSMISKKLNGFVDRYRGDQVDGNNDGDYQSFTSPMHFIENFLDALTNADVDGRVVVNRQGQLKTSSIKFMSLNPAIHFASVAQESRAVVVTGGTMQPTSEFKDQLFACAGVVPDKVQEFSCGHVVASDHLLAVALDKGPGGLQLDFSYQARDSIQLLNECGRLLINVCAVIPGGIVCFFSSFDYANKVYSHWEQTGVLERLNQKKRVFQEPRKASQVEPILSSYATCIKKSSGAILLCVVGGKMSEGINFSDELGRCVVMIGLPYPNIHSPELKEKMNYLNTKVGPNAGQEYYDNLCMKAVNQSIGRAIRHRGDYATILLLDHRYSTPRVYKKLPAWIADRMVHFTHFAPAFGALRKFFVAKRSEENATSDNNK